MIILVLKAIVIFLVYIVTYYTYGVLGNAVLRAKNRGFVLTLLRGMFCYSIIFFCYVVPLKLAKLPLHTISIIWAAIWALSLLAIIVFLRKRYLEPARHFIDYIKLNKLNSILFTVFVVVQIGFDEIFGRWNGSHNPSNYQAYINTAVFTDQLGTTNPITGLPESLFEGKLFTQTFLDHSAVVSKIFNVHPLIEVRNVIPALFILMADLIILLTAIAIFRKNEVKQGIFFSAYQLAIAFTMSSAFLSGYYFYYRNYEGKSIGVLIIAPLFLYILWKLYKNPADKDALRLAVISTIASFQYTGNTFYMIPMAMVGLIPAAFQKGKGRCRNVIWDIVAVCIPCVLYAVFYYFIMKGKIPGFYYSEG